MKKIWANIALAAALVTVVSGCTIVDETTLPSSQAPDASSDPAPDVPGYPEATGSVDTNLVITVLRGNGLAVSTRKLSCAGAEAVNPTTLPDGDAACQLVLDSAAALTSELLPTDDKECKDTGNQVVADVFGESKGTHIMASFMRNNLCNAKVWDGMTPLLGID